MIAQSNDHVNISLFESDLNNPDPVKLWPLWTFNIVKSETFSLVCFLTT
jgi:hypothetical protein